MILEKKEEISEFLEKKLEIDPIKKEKFGEVNTPEVLIQNMLDKLPPSIWKDHTKKWLDPATGIGSFQIFVYDRLLKGLENWEPNFKKRHHHIIENMLYMCEINESSVKQAKKILGEKANIQKCDYLTYDFGKETTYDIILGNPPFNKGQDVEDDGKRGSGNQIWINFVEKSLELISQNGYLLFVHPPGWRKPTTESSKTDGLFKKIAIEHQIEYLEIHNKEDGVKMFGVQTRYDWYLLSNHKCNKKTLVKDESGTLQKIDLRKWNFLPNGEYSLVKHILAKPNEPKVNILYSRTQYGTDSSWTNAKESKKYRYPLIHSTPKGEEPRFYWSSTMEPDIKGELIKMYGQKKVIFGEAGINNIILDNEGKYGMTQGAMGIPFSNQKEGIQIKKCLESTEFEKILKALSFGNFRIDWRIFLFMKKQFFRFLNTKHKSTTKKIYKKNNSKKTIKNN